MGSTETTFFVIGDTVAKRTGAWYDGVVWVVEAIEYWRLDNTYVAVVRATKGNKNLVEGSVLMFRLDELELVAVGWP